MYRTFTAPPPWLLFGPRAEGGRCGPRHMHRHHRWGRGPGGFGPRARRGDVRSALLLLLEEEPRNGYGLMQEIERRSDGLWRPSPGSVYPALAQLEDEGLVTTVEQEGKRLFTLTDEGRAHVEADRERLGQPWEAAGGGPRPRASGRCCPAARSSPWRSSRSAAAARPSSSRPRAR